VSERGWGVVLQGVDDSATYRSMLREIETLGYEHLWITDSSLHTRNCHVQLTVAAMATNRLSIGTAVTNPLTRHPAVTATALATLDELSGGRAVLGIGAGDRPLLELGLVPSTVANLEAAVGAVRRLWSGEHVDVAAEGFTLRDAHLRFRARPDIPIYISASGPRTLQLAGRVADGVILLVGLFPDAVRWALEQVDHGARAVGRRRPHTVVFAYGAIDEDRAWALEQARSIAAWFPQTQPGICRLAGLPDAVVNEVRRAYAGGEFQEAGAAAALLPDGFVRSVALAGNEDDARHAIETVLAAGADAVHVFPLGERRMDTVRAFARCAGLNIGDPR
jgi:5,10-methylenetetrahydromethanopterin reductase